MNIPRTLAALSLLLLIYHPITHAADFSSSKHGFELNLETWSVDREGEKSNYAFGQATNSSNQYRAWFILSRITRKENDEEWQTRQLIDKSVPRFSKNHNGHCDVEQTSKSSASLGTAAGNVRYVGLSCRDGHKTEAAYVTFRSPKDTHRGFIWIYPNANQTSFDKSIVNELINGWRWAE